MANKKPKIEELKNVYKDVFNCKGGELIIEDLKSRYNIDSSMFNPDLRVEDMVYKEGARNVILYLLNQIKTKA